MEERFTSTGTILLLVAAILAGVVFALDLLVMAAIRMVCKVGSAVEKAYRVVRHPKLPQPKFPKPRISEIDVQLQPVATDTIPIMNLESKQEVELPKQKHKLRPRFELPSLKLLEEPPVVAEAQDEKQLRDIAGLLEKTFADFGLKVKVVGIHTGPVVTQYEISLETGLRVSKVTALADDLSLNLKVPSVRIVAPIPGKNTVGIEVPNPNRAVVRLKELILASAAKIEKSKLPLILGKDSEGRALVYDLAEMPHLLIAGRTGTGKSVCLNSIILSLLITRTPEECRLLMIDPKQVELAEYGKLPHLMHPVVTDNSKAEAILSWAVDKMEERYELMRKSRVRNIGGFNELARDEVLRRVKPLDEHEEARIPDKMPYIVIVVDEVGDLMMAMKKEVEGHIIRLAQKSRGGGHPPDPDHPTADGRRHHGVDQIEPARPDLFPSVRPDEQPCGARRDGRGKAAGQGRYAVFATEHQHDYPGPGHLRQRPGNPADRLGVGSRKPGIRQRIAQPRNERGKGGGRRCRQRGGDPKARSALRAGD